MVKYGLLKNGHRIQSVEDWFRYAPPTQKALHWKDGRSAKELAKAFFPQSGDNTLPQELLRLVTSVPGLHELRSVQVVPECRIRFDPFKGGVRNADLAFVVEHSTGRLAATVEAKADETFGSTVAQQRKKARAALSSIPRRIDLLTEALFHSPDLERVGKLRYQLLHATAATLAYADQNHCSAAVFVIVEFNTPSCLTNKLACNASDLDAFLETLGGQTITHINLGTLLGPIVVPGNKYIPAPVPLFIGKVARTVV